MTDGFNPFSGHVCGRLTKNGRPCRNQTLHFSAYACQVHATDEDRIWQERLNDAFHRGQAWEAIAARKENVRLQARIARLEELNALQPKRRERDARGRQLVVVKGYTYHWNGDEPLQVGDNVMLPGSWWSKDPWFGKVQQIGSDYQGTTVGVLTRLVDA